MQVHPNLNSWHEENKKKKKRKTTRQIGKIDVSLYHLKISEGHTINMIYSLSHWIDVLRLETKLVHLITRVFFKNKTPFT